MRKTILLVLIAFQAQAKAANHLVLCRDHLRAPGAALDMMEAHVFDRPIPYAGHDEGALASAYDKLGVHHLRPDILRNFILSVWRPRNGSAVAVDLFRFERKTLRRVRQFRLKDIQPQTWRPLMLDERQTEQSHETVRQMRNPPSLVTNGLSYDHVGYQSEPDHDGVRLVLSTRYAPSDRTVQLTLGLDVPPEQLSSYAFPDAEATRVKTPEGDFFRIGLLTFAADKL